MVFARQVITTLEASAKIFGTYIKPNPLGYPTGRDILQKPLTIDRLNRDHYAVKDLAYERLKIPWRFIEKHENQYWKAFRRARKGLFTVAKGQGKKALKRAKEAAKAASKAKK